MNTIKIHSKLSVVGSIPHWSEAVIKDEPMLFQCDVNNAWSKGGPITRSFISALPSAWLEGPLVIDTRVHMLMPGWFPCIPGWHHDDVPRTRTDGQPNYSEGQDRSVHILALCNGDICPTQFALGEAEFMERPEGEIVYEGWHKDVQALVDSEKLIHLQAPSNKLILFNDRTWHQGTPAIANGWRWFGRVSIHADSQGNRIERRGGPANEVRSQCQVYMPNPFEGW